MRTRHLIAATGVALAPALFASTALSGTLLTVQYPDASPIETGLFLPDSYVEDTGGFRSIVDVAVIRPLENGNVGFNLLNSDIFTSDVATYAGRNFTATSALNGSTRTLQIDLEGGLLDGDYEFIVLNGEGGGDTDLVIDFFTGSNSSEGYSVSLNADECASVVYSVSGDNLTGATATEGDVLDGSDLLVDLSYCTVTDTLIDTGDRPDFLSGGDFNFAGAGRALTGPSVASTLVSRKRLRTVATAVRARTRALATDEGFDAGEEDEQNGDSTGVNGGDAMDQLWNELRGRTAFWVRPSYSRVDGVDDRLTGAKFDGTTKILMGGMDYVISPDLFVGGNLSYEISKVSFDTGGDRRGEGLGLGLYAVKQVTPEITGNIYVGATGIDNDIGRAGLEGDRRSWRYNVALGGSYRKEIEDFSLTGFAGVNYSLEKFSGYTTSGETRVAGVNDHLGQVSLGGEVAYEAHEWVPYASLSGEWDFRTDNDGDSNGGFVGGGVRYLAPSGMTADLGVQYQIGRDDADELTFSGTLRWLY